MTMDSLLLALRLNNEAVNLLTEKRIPEAVRSFEAALLGMKQATVEGSGWNRAVPLAGRGEQRDFLLLGPRIGLESDVCFIFDRPMLVPCDPKIDTCADVELFVHWTSTVTVFNYALACHHYSMVSGSDTGLQKAVCLYKLAIKMAASSESDRVMYAVLECAALSNLAHALYEQCSFGASVSSSLAVYDKVSVTSDLDSYLSQDEIENLLMISLYLQAPAAAQAA
jgi:hypothetical protein